MQWMALVEIPVSNGGGCKSAGLTRRWFSKRSKSQPKPQVELLVEDSGKREEYVIAMRGSLFF